MPRTRNPVASKSFGMKTRSGKTANPRGGRGAAQGPTTRARTTTQAQLAASQATATTRKAPSCKHCGKPRAGHGKKCLDGYSKAKELEQMLDKADALAKGVAEAEAVLLRQRVDEEVAKVVDSNDGAVSIEDVVMTLAPQIAEATGGALSMEALFEALPALGSKDEDAADAAAAAVTAAAAAAAAAVDAMNLDAGKISAPVSPAKSAMAVDTAVETGAVAEKGPASPAEITNALVNGWKSTPAGDTPLELERNGAKKAAYPSQIERSKRIPRLFQAMAQKGDVLANRVDGWAFCMFVPKNGRGEMRTWHSEQVEAEVPTLPGRMRELAFQALEPICRQRLAEAAKIDETRRKELKRWQKEAAKAQDEVASLRAQLDEAVKSLNLEKAMKAVA